MKGKKENKACVVEVSNSDSESDSSDDEEEALDPEDAFEEEAAKHLNPDWLPLRQPLTNRKGLTRAGPRSRLWLADRSSSSREAAAGLPYDSRG